MSELFIKNEKSDLLALFSCKALMSSCFISVWSSDMFKSVWDCLFIVLMTEPSVLKFLVLYFFFLTVPHCSIFALLSYSLSWPFSIYEIILFTALKIIFSMTIPKSCWCLYNLSWLSLTAANIPLYSFSKSMSCCASILLFFKSAVSVLFALVKIDLSKSMIIFTLFLQ